MRTTPFAPEDSIQRRARKRCGRPAFSLVELLVSIAVIALLTGLSFAAYSRVFEARSSSGCVANLRQLGAATLLFSTEHNNRFPALIYMEDGAYKSFWYKELRPYLGADSIVLGYDPETGQQYNLDVFYCSSVDASAAYPHTHYGANRYVLLPPSEATPLTMNPVYNVPEPAHTVLYSENLDPTSSKYPQAGWQIVPSRVRSAPDSYIPIDRHNGHVNMVFVDGHTESMEASILKDKIDDYFGEDYFE